MPTDTSTRAIITSLGFDPDAPMAALPAWAGLEALARRLAPHDPAEPEWMPTQEAARYLRVTPKTLRSYADGSPVIVRRKGAGRAPDRYSRQSLDAYIESRPSSVSS